MAEYIAKATLVHNGQIVKIDETVELTEEQAKHLGDKVEKKAAAKKSSKEKE
ncbi:hypothetical protein [Pseudobacillus badius]|uniref:DUF7210 family protein n=1 Tax=Bacillus badius TaxID=1455 RepID=UPI0024A3F3C3|nr:hypothetical protein [Bacillus badius]GLY11411.1 hypothetical protein Bbad01_26270 [Bacillus badius]